VDAVSRVARLPLRISAIALAVVATLGFGAPAGAAPGRVVGAAGVTARLPAGWVSQSSGTTLTIARSAADLSALAPRRGRLTLRALGCGTIDLNAVLLKSSNGITHVSAPARVQVSGHPAATIEYTSQRHGAAVRVRAFVIPLSRARAYEMTFEAAAGSWASALAGLSPVAQTLSFARSARCP